MRRSLTICVEKNEKEKRARIRKIRGVIVFSTTFLLLTAAAWGDLINIDVYSGFQDTGGGEPYTHPVGSLTASDVNFGTATGWKWKPFGLTKYGADITGFLQVATSKAYSFTLDSDDGSMLYINNSLIVDDGGPHVAQTRTGIVDLAAGTYPFEVQFFEDFGMPAGVNLTLPKGVSYTPEPTTLCLLALGAVLLRRSRK
jgi:hypothetical protein